MISHALYDIVRNGGTLTQQVADNPQERICKLAEKMFAGFPRASKKERVQRGREDYSEEELEQAFQCGKFPYRPSDLFLMVCDYLNYGS